jgi:hypothetical protein
MYGVAVAEFETVSTIFGAVAKVTGNVIVTVAGVPDALGPVNVVVPVSTPVLSALDARFAKCVSSGAMLSPDVGYVIPLIVLAIIRSFR